MQHMLALKPTHDNVYQTTLETSHSAPQLAQRKAPNSCATFFTEECASYSLFAETIGRISYPTFAVDLV